MKEVGEDVEGPGVRRLDPDLVRDELTPVSDDRIMAELQRALGRIDAHVAGNVGVNSPEGSLKLSHDSVVADGRELVADKVRIQPPNARAFDVFANLLHLGKGAIVGGTITQPVSPPIYDPEPLVLPDPFDPANFPPAFPITCGGPDRAGGTGESFVLTPGSSGTVCVGTNGEVTLQAGTYEFCSLVVVKYGGIFV